MFSVHITTRSFREIPDLCACVGTPSVHTRTQVHTRRFISMLAVQKNKPKKISLFTFSISAASMDLCGPVGVERGGCKLRANQTYYTPLADH